MWCTGVPQLLLSAPILNPIPLTPTFLGSGGFYKIANTHGLACVTCLYGPTLHPVVPDSIMTQDTHPQTVLYV